MKALQIKGGDLVVGEGGFTTVAGTQKLYQDLSILVREPLGADRFHPRWGGILNDFIGMAIQQGTVSEIQSEISRLIQNYMVMQSRMISADITLDRRPRYKPEEIIVNVDAINVQQVQDRLNIKVVVSTASGDQIDIVRSVV